ncbi:MAG: phosphoribosyltransferase [Natronincolaceae bacterium]|jgi:putative phosphoribosyl transferase|nr:phosphoribosyltransferase family protein [Bacillota bacterium]
MFEDRRHAGIKLTEKLKDFDRCDNYIIFAIPRGGVVVGAEVAQRLHLPLDLIITKKIRAPYNPELAIGSMDPTGKINVDQTLVSRLDVSPAYLQKEAETTMAQIKKQLEQYRKSADYPNLEHTTAIIVDDGIATGQTVMAAIGFLRNLHVQRIIVATPVVAPSTLSELSKLVDEVRYVLCEEHFFAVGQFYRDFTQINDEQVINIMTDFR